VLVIEANLFAGKNLIRLNLLGLLLGKTTKCGVILGF